MKLSISIQGMDEAQQLLANLVGGRKALAMAINDTLFKVRDDEVAGVRSDFDRPTPFIQRSPFVVQAGEQDLMGYVELKYPGGKAVPPEKVLRAEVFGGPRHLKRFERALQRIGILPNGYYVVPGAGCRIDSYGNIPGPFLVQLLSYFQAFGEQGYRANMTAKRKRSLAKLGKNENGFRVVNGVQYFVAYPRSLRSGSTEHFSQPGIYSRTGIHGSNVKPILIFVKSPTYPQRFDFYGIAQATITQRVGRNVAYRLARLIGKPE